MPLPAIDTWPPYEPIPMTRLATDQKTVAERQWQKAKLAPKEQKPCDHGLFSDDSKQTELF